MIDCRLAGSVDVVADVSWCLLRQGALLPLSAQVQRQDYHRREAKHVACSLGSAHSPRGDVDLPIVVKDDCNAHHAASQVRNTEMRERKEPMCRITAFGPQDMRRLESRDSSDDGAA